MAPWSSEFEGRLTAWAGLGSYGPGVADFDNCLPARNALLDPGVSGVRAATYEGFGVAAAADTGEWYQRHKRYLRIHVYRRAGAVGRSTMRPDEAGDTFTVSARTAEYGNVAGNLDLVRVIRLSWLVEAGKVREDDVAAAIGDESKMQFILDRAAARDDGRPVFAAFRQDIADLVPIDGEGDPPPGWADDLRDRLGLAQLEPTPVGPTRVLVVRYAASEVPRVIGTPVSALLAVPGVLDMDPFPAFCPAPQGAPVGQLVELAPRGGRAPATEVLHPPMRLEARHVVRIGEITRAVPPVPPSRRMHIQWLRSAYDPQFAASTDADLLA
jgi:hypothetical protein